MALQFKRAQRERRKARIALIGVTGGGKTWTALELALGLAGPGGRIGIIDTERGSASLYADRATFDVLELESFAAERYIAAIEAAVTAGYEVLVIDSWSHAWAGKDGILEFVDTAAKRHQGNKFVAWSDATPKQHKMVDAILTAPCHVIVTMRVKMEYVQEKDERGRTVIRKVGLQPIQRDGVEHEFDLIGDLTLDHDLIVSKTRYSWLAGRVISNPTRALGEEIAAWLASGVAPSPAPAASPASAASASAASDIHKPTDATSDNNRHGKEHITEAQRRRMWAIAKRGGHKEDQVRDWLGREYGLESTSDITPSQYEAICTRLLDTTALVGG